MKRKSTSEIDQKKIESSNQEPSGDHCGCTIYDFNFDYYQEGVVCSNKVFAVQDNGNLVPPKNLICEYVCYGMVQFFMGIMGNEVEICSHPPKWGYFDYDTGNIVIAPQYDYAGPFDGKLAWVIKAGKQGFIDPEGTEVISIIWDEVKKGYRNEEHIGGEWVKRYDPWAVRKGDKWGYINQKGDIVIPLEFDHAERFEGDRAEVKIGNNYGYINKRGELAIIPEYEKVYPFRFVEMDQAKSCYIALVKKDGKFGFIDEEGNRITECIFDGAFEYSNIGFSAVKLNDKWSLINTSGDYVIYNKFDDFCYYYGRLCETGSISKANWLHLPSQGKELRSDVYFVVKVNHQWGLMDIDFNVFLPEKNKRFVEFKGYIIHLQNGIVTKMRKIAGSDVKTEVIMQPDWENQPPKD